jgi:hypothetical protein
VGARSFLRFGRAIKTSADAKVTLTGGTDNFASRQPASGDLDQLAGKTLEGGSKLGSAVRFCLRECDRMPRTD